MTTEKDKDKDGAPAPAVSFSTKEEFTAFVEKKIGEALAPKLQQIDLLRAQADEAKALKERTAELERKLAGKTLTDEEKWQRSVDEKEAQRAALQQQLEASQQAIESTKGQWFASERDRYLQALAVEAGAAPSAVGDIPALFPRKSIRVEASDGAMPTVSIVDPETGMTVNPKEAMQAFLNTKPHLRAPQTGGSGARGAGAPGAPPKRDILAEPDQAGAFIGAMQSAGMMK